MIMKRFSKAVFSFVLATALMFSTGCTASACLMPNSAGRYIANAVVYDMYPAERNQIEVWCSDTNNGDDWVFLVDTETDLRIGDRIDLLIDSQGTPTDYSDDVVIDCFYCHDCDEIVD